MAEPASVLFVVWFVALDRRFPCRTRESGTESVTRPILWSQSEVMVTAKGLSRVVGPCFGTQAGIVLDGSVTTHDVGTQENRALNVKWPEAVSAVSDPLPNMPLQATL
jgi:hypothetical protein